jgi:hypothetical protein
MIATAPPGAAPDPPLPQACVWSKLGASHQNQGATGSRLAGVSLTEDLAGLLIDFESAFFCRVFVLD